MAIFDIDFNLVYKLLLPPSKRKDKFIAWASVLMKPLQWLRDLMFVEYADGFTGAAWSNTPAYVKGDRVRYLDRSVYEALQNVPAATIPPDNPSYWLKVQDLWIGLRERAKYNGRKLLLEYILNKWFDTVFRQPTTNDPSPDFYLPKSDIYISNGILNNNVFRVGISEDESSFVSRDETQAIDYVMYSGAEYSFIADTFTINIPVIVYITLGSDAETREGAVRAIADKYVIAGMKYNILTY